MRKNYEAAFFDPPFGGTNVCTSSIARWKARNTVKIIE